jgi:hypothetical protein
MQMERIKISLSLMESDMPDIPASLPIGVSVSVQEEAFLIEAARTSTIAADTQFSFEIPKHQIVRAVVRYKPDVPDDFQYGPWNQPVCSQLTLVHLDPYEVVSEFTTTFESEKSYWIKAAKKLLVDKLNIEITDESDA